MICPFSNTHCTKTKCWHVTDIVAGQAITNDACEDCVGYLVGTKKKKTMKEQIEETLDLISKSKELIAKSKSDLAPLLGTSLKTCPKCGWGAADIFLTHGKLGCPGCYDFFARDLDIMLKNFHKIDGGVQHRGKVPQKKSLASMRTLREQLAIAVKIEDYELAAKIKKQINELQPTYDEQRALIKQLQAALTDKDAARIAELKNKLDDLSH